MTELSCIKGVRVLGSEPTDLLLRDGVVGRGRAATCPPTGAEVVDADGLVALPGPGRPAHPPARAGPRGRRDGRVRLPGGRAGRLHRGLRDGQHLAGGRHRRAWSSRCGGSAGETGLVDVQPIGAVTVGLAGERLAELGAMADSAARVRIFSDDGHCVADPRLMRRALEYVKAFDGVIAQHAEEPRLTEGAQMHEGARLGHARPARLAGGRRGGDHRPRRAAGRARRRPAARVPRLHRRQRGDPALGQAAGHRRDGRGDPAPPAAHRRAGARVRPGVQGEPAAADRGRRGRAARRAWSTA